ncbi:MAG: MFS transporter [Candidatus Methanomethylophilaceae archaeon]|nr:MFS transporter [Candidatus Methanomethylophilaceae archaeon]
MGEGIVTGRFLSAAASCFFMTVVFFVRFTAVPSYSMEVLGTDAAVAGVVAGVFIIGDIAGRIALGNRIWEIGPNRLCAGSMAVGTALSAVCLLTDDMGAICAAGLAQGFTYGVAELCVFSRISADLPPKLRGRGMGYFTLSYSLASAVGPFMSIHMVNAGLYRDVFLIGLAASALSTVSALGMGKDGGAGIGTSAGPRPTSAVRRALPISVVTFVFLVSYSGVLTFIAPYGMEKGLEDYAAAFYIVLSAATVVSRIAVMRRYDSAGPDRVMVPMLAIHMAGMILLGLTQGGFQMLASAFLVGLALAAVQATSQAMAVEGLDARGQSASLATVQVFIDLSYFVGPAANGAASAALGYSGCYVAMAGVGAAALLLYVVSCSGGRRRDGSARGRCETFDKDAEPPKNRH